MKRVFKTRDYPRGMRKTGLSDDALCATVAEMAQGLVNADLGGGVFKKRVGISGRGKRAGARTLVASNREQGESLVFVFGFEKNDHANLSDEELEALKDLAAQLLARRGKPLDDAANDGSLTEIGNDHKI